MKNNITSHILQSLLVCIALCLASPVAAQKEEVSADSISLPHAVSDSVVVDRAVYEDSVVDGRIFMADTLKTVRPKRNWATWRPSAKRAMWLAIVLPGAGQIYNRKYWKLPFVYGGFVGCAYAMRWNNQMFRDYSQAYMDIMDDDPNTQSYNQFLHLGAKIDSSNLQRYQRLFKNRKDKFRRWRDLSFFCLVGVYAISIIDAYVDASLSEFDISKDLSLRVEPTIINRSNGMQTNPLRDNSLGVSCSLNF